MSESAMEDTGVDRRVSSRHSGRKRPFYGSSSEKALSKKNRESINLNQDKEEVVAGEVNNNNIAANLQWIAARKRVEETIRLFNEHYQQQVEKEAKRCKKASKSKKKRSRRPDLKALTKMKMTNKALFHRKRIGELPGIDVGLQLSSRAVMVAVGLHQQTMKGIDYMTAQEGHKVEQYKKYNFPLAVAVVISGMYEDNEDELDEIVYTGEGQGHDQKLEGANLALVNSMKQSLNVRVIRGHKSKNSDTGKFYTYDGLYKVIRHLIDECGSGYKVHKFQLKRNEGQPTLTTAQVHYIGAKASASAPKLRGRICEDISGGKEEIPIPAYNLVDDPPVAPTDYTYCKSIQLGEGVTYPEDAAGCSCEGACTDPEECACAKLNGSDFPYISTRDGGRLTEPKSVIFECGPNCRCGEDCVNKTTQQGLRYRLEVFRTSNKGWAVRSKDVIPSGAPVCEYTGVLRLANDCEKVTDNEYLFDIDFKETMEGRDGRQSRGGVVSIPTTSCNDESGDKAERQARYCIDAGTHGGVARFINHSCGPNLFVQGVLSSHHKIELARVMLFAGEDDIPRLHELTYDYGYQLNSVTGPDGDIKELACHCGAEGCRRRLY